MNLQTSASPNSSAKVIELSALRAWARRHPKLWATIVLSIASCAFVWGFGQVAHWTNGAQQGKLAYDCKWDCGWYQTIVSRGYDAAPYGNPDQDAANWAFFPLFPMSAAVLKSVFRVDPFTATVLASKLELFGAIYAFLLWLRPHLSGFQECFFAGSLVALNPYLIYAHAGYSEPLYLMIACLGFWALERQRWILAGALGALLSADRFVGLLFALTYAMVALREVAWLRRAKSRPWDMLIGLLLCPLGLVLFALYLYHRTGDALAFAHVQVAWGRGHANPFAVLWHTFYQHGWQRVWAVMVVIGLGVSGWLLRRYPQYGVFLLLSVLIPCTSGTLISFPRYLWWQPPFLFVIFLWLRRSVPAWIIYTMFSGGMASFMIIQWFTGNMLVI